MRPCARVAMQQSLPVRVFPIKKPHKRGAVPPGNPSKVLVTPFLLLVTAFLGLVTAFSRLVTPFFGLVTPFEVRKFTLVTP